MQRNAWTGSPRVGCLQLVSDLASSLPVTHCHEKKICKTQVSICFIHRASAHLAGGLPAKSQFVLGGGQAVGTLAACIWAGVCGGSGAEEDHRPRCAPPPPFTVVRRSLCCAAQCTLSRGWGADASHFLV